MWVTLMDVDADRGAVAEGLGVDSALPADARSGCDLVVHASQVRLALGGAFRSGRLSIRASQVGTVSPTRRGRRAPAHRIVDGLPDVMARLADGSLPALSHTISSRSGRS